MYRISKTKLSTFNTGRIKNNQTMPFCSRCVPGAPHALQTNLRLRTVPPVGAHESPPRSRGAAASAMVAIAAAGIGGSFFGGLVGFGLLLGRLGLSGLFGGVGVGLRVVLDPLRVGRTVVVVDGFPLAVGCQAGIAPGLGAHAVLATHRLALTVLADGLVLSGWRARRGTGRLPAGRAERLEAGRTAVLDVDAQYHRRAAPTLGGVLEQDELAPVPLLGAERTRDAVALEGLEGVAPLGCALTLLLLQTVQDRHDLEGEPLEIGRDVELAIPPLLEPGFGQRGLALVERGRQPVRIELLARGPARGLQGTECLAPRVGDGGVAHHGALVLPPGVDGQSLAFEQVTGLVALGGSHDRGTVERRTAPVHEGVERRSVHVFLVRRDGELPIGLARDRPAVLQLLAQLLDCLLVAWVDAGLVFEGILLGISGGRLLDRIEPGECVLAGGAVELLDLDLLGQRGQLLRSRPRAAREGQREEGEEGDQPSTPVVDGAHERTTSFQGLVGWFVFLVVVIQAPSAMVATR